MATRTPNLSLIKPGPDDAVDVADLNENFDKIDNFAGGVGGDTYTKSEIDEMLAEKVNTEEGKGLSSNDFTDSDKVQISANKAGIGAVANSGAKNLFKNVANSRTYSGVTFSVSADGTVSTSGSATPNVAVLEIGSVTLPAGTYIISGCPEGGAWSGGTNKYRIRVAVNDAWRGDEKGNGFSVTLNDGDTISLQINTAIDFDVTDLVFKPMIRPASIKDDTYVPYAPTNRELYEMILALQSGA